jgi:hypothetical protein
MPDYPIKDGAKDAAQWKYLPLDHEPSKGRRMSWLQYRGAQRVTVMTDRKHHKMIRISYVAGKRIVTTTIIPSKTLLKQQRRMLQPPQQLPSRVSSRIICMAGKGNKMKGGADYLRTLYPSFTIFYQVCVPGLPRIWKRP